MSKLRFRVKPYVHRKYKFVVRGKVLGKWRRRYFETEAEAIDFAAQQNAKVQRKNGDASFSHDVTTPRRARPVRGARSTTATDFATLVTPVYRGPQIRRYLGDSWCMHLPFAYDLMREFAPKIFVELGVKQGESYFCFCQSAAENKINVRCYGVDSWRGDIQTGALDPEIQSEVAQYNWQYSSFSEFKAMHFAEALGDFPDASIDLLHIDGTHTYDDVKADFESWLPKVSPNGIILLHDVILRDRGFGVWKLWEEIAREDNSFLFEFGYGLGVWKKQPVGSSDSFLVRKLLGANKIERRDINEYYANAASALALWESLRGQFGAGEQFTQLQHDLEERSQQLAQFRTEVEERLKLAGQLQSESEQQSKLVDQLKNELETSQNELARAKEQLLDARWEALTLRGNLARKTDLIEIPSSRLLELETQVQTITSERDQLLTMLAAVQSDLEQERLTGQAQKSEFRATQAQLTKMAQDLRSQEKQMDRLRESISGRLILPFGKAQRKLRQLAATRRSND